MQRFPCSVAIELVIGAGPLMSTCVVVVRLGMAIVFHNDLCTNIGVCFLSQRLLLIFCLAQRTCSSQLNSGRKSNQVCLLVLVLS